MSELVTIAVFDDLSVACVARSKIENAGIPCFLENEHMISMNWLYSNALGGIRLQVPGIAAAEAAALLTSEAEDMAAVEDECCPEVFQNDGENFYGCGESEAEQDNPGAEADLLCPRCGSADLDSCSLRRPLGALSWLIGFPLPFAPRWNKCRACGHRWR